MIFKNHECCYHDAQEQAPTHDRGLRSKTHHYTAIQLSSQQTVFSGQHKGEK